MAPLPGVWGIDVGQCALKAIRVELVNGVVTATDCDYVEHPKILSQPDADPDQLTREALEKFLKRNRLRGDIIAMSVPGQSGLARFVKLPPVEEKKISDIVKFEAKQQIPFNLEEVVWDYQKIGSGVVADGFAMETEIGLFAIKRDAVYRALQHFQEVNVEVQLVQMAPLALCNFISYELLHKDVSNLGEAAEDTKGKKQCVVALDVGVEVSNLVVTDGERIIWQRPIPIGGNRFTRALTKELKLTFAKAEHLKKNAAKTGQAELKRILQALTPDLNEFGNELQKSLNYFTNAHRDAHIQYMVGLGGAFRLPGLQKFLHGKLQLEVRKFARFERLQGDSVVTAPVFNDNILTMPVAFGLAVQGLKVARLQTNLLPPEIQTERLIRSKKPWAVAAAAALLLGTGSLAFGYKLKHDAVEAPVVKSALKEGDEALAKKTQSDAEFQKKEGIVHAIEHDIRTILAGEDERVNWLALNKFVNDALPRPDIGVNDQLKGQRPNELTYWDKKGGKQAYDKYKARLNARGDSIATAEEGAGQLLQINLEAVNALYSDDLTAYFTKLKEKAESEMGSMKPEEDQKVAPKGRGWVVEVRGYTYNEGGRQFLLDTFVENLARKTPPPSADPAKSDADKPEVTKPDAGKPDAGKPAKPEGGKPEGGKPEGRRHKEKPPADPVYGLVSHVLLYKYNSKDAQVAAGKFDLIDKTALPELLNAARGGGEGRGPGGPGGPGPGGRPGRHEGVGDASSSHSRAGWVPLGGGASALGNGPVGREAGPGPVGPANPATSTTEPSKQAKETKTEFVILFVWREPTPSTPDAPKAAGGSGGPTARPAAPAPGAPAPPPPASN
jgi:type IV pilus assembly protein PilM